jgi:hypothetical protein
MRANRKWLKKSILNGYENDAAVAGIVAPLRAARAQGVSHVMEAIALGCVRPSLSTRVSRVVEL